MTEYKVYPNREEADKAASKLLWHHNGIRRVTCPGIAYEEEIVVITPGV